LLIALKIQPGCTVRCSIKKILYCISKSKEEVFLEYLSVLEYNVPDVTVFISVAPVVHTVVFLNAFNLE
jgi:hypothetical protein